MFACIFTNWDKCKTCKYRFVNLFAYYFRPCNQGDSVLPAGNHVACGCMQTYLRNGWLQLRRNLKEMEIQFFEDHYIFLPVTSINIE